MDILGVGFNELVFILIIALIILGPKDMQKAGRTIGKWMRTIVTSDGWKVFQQASRELRTLPNKLMREANEELSEIDGEMRRVISPPGRRPAAPGMQPQVGPAPQAPRAERASTPDQEGNA
jgi:Sec-independent protein translocase protein TatA